ncbi:MAG: zinc ribbon domain-containing protein [Promethearchaeota archaeon]|jgi:hypothetical protein
MNREKNTWFGINLTQRQSTSLFVLSIAGTLITSLMLLQMFTPLLIMVSAPYYGDMSYFFQTLLIMSPYYVGISIGLILSVYTLIKSRKIAKTYSQIMPTNISKTASANFCPNCGNKRSVKEMFCNQCGQEFR